jgi:hypothetical protein
MENMEEQLTATIAIDRPEKDEKTIPVICSRCDTIFELPRWLVEEGKRVAPSHGLCPDCHDIMLMEHQELLAERDGKRSENDGGGRRKGLWPRFVQPFLPVSRRDGE